MSRKIVTFTGNNGAGAISVPGVKAGDKILSLVSTGSGLPLGTPLLNDFIDFVLTNGQIVQTVGSDFTIYTLTALLERKVMLP